jgi:predicted transcriptional regulator of viral defense system
MSAVVLQSLPPVFSHGDARSRGISDRQLYAWRDMGALETLGRGIYLRPGSDVQHDLLEIAVRAPDATLCLVSALARHGLVDDIPPVMDIALPRHQRQPRTAVLVRWHRFDASTITIDRGTFDTGAGRSLGIYGPQRSIVDAFRLRHLYGTEQAVTALRRWLSQRGSQPSELLRIASSFPASETPLREALKILL